MDDYISREAALDCFTDWIDRYGHEHTADEMIEYQRIEELPAADVRPVEHGEWTYIAHVPFGHDYECSVCKQRNYEKSNFCPYCGAVMRDNPVIIGLDMGGETNGK